MLKINATQVKEGYSGVGVYSIKVIERIVKKISTGIIYTCLNIFNNIPLSWQVKQVRIIDRDMARWLWHQYIFPFSLNKNDVLYCPFSEAPSRFKGRLIITVHDLMPLNFPEKHSKKLKYYYNNVLRRNLEKAFGIIVISETTKADIIKFFPEIDLKKINVIHNGYDKTIFNTDYDSAAMQNFRNSHKLNDYILYVGRISKIKNVMRLIKAYGLIKDKTELKLLIIGKDESGVMTEANEFIQNNGLKERVVFIERLQETEIQFAYKGASVFIQPSLSEGFGLPAIEAMACGVPCILSDIDAFREISDGASLFFNPENENELAEKILLLLNNKSEYNSLKEKGLKRSEDFDWDKTAEKISIILNKALTVK